MKKDKDQTKPQAQVTVLTAEFLKKRGLPRDKANYVMAVVRMRQEVRHLMRTATDSDVVQELLCLDEFFDDTVTTMYAAAGETTNPNPKGAA